MTIRQEFQKERRRLLQAIRRAEKKGYIVDRDAVPDLPKKVTRKHLEDIKNIKSRSVYKKPELSERNVVPELLIGKGKRQQNKFSSTIDEPKLTEEVGHFSTSKPKKTPKTKQKPKKPKLTPEQLKEKRKIAGKKAWETRKKKMLEEGTYEEYINEMKKRLKYGKEAKKQGVPYKEYREQQELQQNRPTYDAIEEIEYLINQIPSSLGIFSGKTRMFVHWEWEEEFPLMQTFHSALATNDLDELEAFYKENMQELQASLTVWKYASKQEHIAFGFSRAIVLLRGGNALTLTEAKELSEKLENVDTTYSE